MQNFKLLSYCVSHICMMSFISCFSRHRYGRVKNGLLLGLAALLLILLETVPFAFPEYRSFRPVYLLLQIIVVQGTALMVSEYRDSRALFTGLTSSNYALMGTMVGGWIYAWTRQMGISLVLTFIFHIAILGLLNFFIRDSYLEIQREEQGSWMAMCLVPSLFYVSALVLGWVMRNHEQTMVLVLVLGFMAAMYVAYGLIFRMIQNLYREGRYLKSQEILRAGIRSLKHDMEQMETAERRIRQHSQAHQRLLVSIQERLRRGDYDGVEQLLTEMEELTHISRPRHYCENVPLNGVIAYYMAEAKEQGVDFILHPEIPGELPIDDWKLAVVLGNLLDNAFRECRSGGEQKNQTVRLLLRMVRGKLLMEVRNRCEKAPDFDKESGLPLSARGEGHGYGVRNAKHFVEQCQGMFDCGVENREFFVRILV